MPVSEGKSVLLLTEQRTEGACHSSSAVKKQALQQQQAQCISLSASTFWPWAVPGPAP